MEPRALRCSATSTPSTVRRPSARLGKPAPARVRDARQPLTEQLGKTTVGAGGTVLPLNGHMPRAPEQPLLSGQSQALEGLQLVGLFPHGGHCTKGAFEHGLETRAREYCAVSLPVLRRRSRRCQKMREVADGGRPGRADCLASLCPLDVPARNGRRERQPCFLHGAARSIGEPLLETSAGKKAEAEEPQTPGCDRDAMAWRGEHFRRSTFGCGRMRLVMLLGTREGPDDGGRLRRKSNQGIRAPAPKSRTPEGSGAAPRPNCAQEPATDP